MQSTAGNGLIVALQQCLRQKDINSCCGVLRRLVSESQPHEQQRFVLPNPHDKGNWLDHPSVGECLWEAQRASVSSLRQPSLSILAHVAQRKGKWMEALHFTMGLRQAPSPEFVSSLVFPTNWRSVNRVRRARRWRWNVPVILEAFGATGNWSEALSLATAAERESGPLSEKYRAGVLIPLMAQRGDQWRDAMTMFYRSFFSGHFQEPNMLVAMIKGSAKGGRWEVCMRIAGAADRSQALNEVSDASVFQSLIEVCPCWDGCLSIFDRVRKNALTPDQRMIQLVLAKCDAAGAWEAATRVYDEAVEGGFLQNIGGESYAAVVRSFHAASQWERAVKALSWMSFASDAAAQAGMCELVELCESSGQWDVALQVGAQLLQQHSQRHVGEPLRLPSSTYMSLVFACGTGKLWSGAISTYQLLLADTSVSPPPLAACSVLQACHAARRWTAALEFFSLVWNAKPRVIVPPIGLSLAMKSCVDAKRWHEALELLHLMHEEGLPLDNHSQKLGMWASALCGSWQESLVHFSKIPPHHRSHHDTLVVRTAAKYAGPLATAAMTRAFQKR